MAVPDVVQAIKAISHLAKQMIKENQTMVNKPVVKDRSRSTNKEINQATGTRQLTKKEIEVFIYYTKPFKNENGFSIQTSL